MIKTILFDLGGVLFESGTDYVIEMVCSKYGVNFERASELFGEKNKKEGWKYRRGMISKDDYWAHIKNEGLNPDKVRELWFGSYKLNETALVILRKLRKKHRVIAFSDNIREKVEYLDKKYDFLKEFDNHFFSFEVGSNKSEPKFYTDAIKNLKLNPKETLIIDDHQKHLDLAKKSGIIGILGRLDNLENELHELKVL